VAIAEKVFKVRGQDYSETKCTFSAEAYISAVWRQGLLVFQLQSDKHKRTVRNGNCIRFKHNRIEQTGA